MKQMQGTAEYFPISRSDGFIAVPYNYFILHVSAIQCTHMYYYTFLTRLITSGSEDRSENKNLAPEKHSHCCLQNKNAVIALVLTHEAKRRTGWVV